MHESNIINRKNLRGQAPLYVATQNGNVNIIKLLISRGANPYILSAIDGKSQESVLEVCCRWNHYSTLEFLLKNIEWPSSIIQKALKKCGNKDMKKIFKNAVIKK